MIFGLSAAKLVYNWHHKRVKNEEENKKKSAKARAELRDGRRDKSPHTVSK